MDDYIEREAALAFPFANGRYDREHANEHFIFGCESYKEWLEQLPAADVVARDCYDRLLAENDELRKERPVRHGRWIKARGSWCTPGGDPVWECSECGKGMHVYGIEHRTYGSDVADGQWAACPNCGANMKDGDGDV